MKIAFDFDGTITAHPQRMNAMARAFHNTGHHIIILTAAAGELPPADRTAEVARRVTCYGFTCPHELACVEGRDKGKWCAAHAVDVIIDDDADFLERIKATSPKTLRLQVGK